MPLKKLFAIFLISVLSMPIVVSGAEDDDEAINLSPVKKGETKPGDDAPVATAVPTLEATALPTPAPTAAATPKPRPQKKLTRIDALNISQDEAGVHLHVAASGSLRGVVKSLKNPDRLLISFASARLGQKGLSKDINLGSAVRARLAAHPGDAVWLVIDLIEPITYSANSTAAGYAMTLQTGVKAVPVAPRRIADLPKINLMFFDLNVLFQGKQYDRFPCANFIYDKTDSFPLTREFVTTLVFHSGYGAFVGNLRVVDPKGNVIDHTKDPVAFNLFSELFDYSVEVPWKLEFPSKGFYTLVLTLNGEDVMEHRFYVGHNDDKPGR